MHSLRTRITLMTVCVVLFALTAVMAFSVYFIRTNEHHKSEQLLLLLCETGERNLEYYFTSVQRSVRRVASFATADLEGLEEEQLRRLITRAYEALIERFIDEFLERFHVAEIVEAKINAMDVKELERLVLSVMKHELNAIVNLGALIGFLLGLFNLLW